MLHHYFGIVGCLFRALFGCMLFLCVFNSILCVAASVQFGLNFSKRILYEMSGSLFATKTELPLKPQYSQKRPCYTMYYLIEKYCREEEEAAFCAQHPLFNIVLHNADDYRVLRSAAAQISDKDVQYLCPVKIFQHCKRTHGKFGFMKASALRAIKEHEVLIHEVSEAYKIPLNKHFVLDLTFAINRLSIAATSLSSAPDWDACMCAYLERCRLGEEKGL